MNFNSFYPYRPDVVTLELQIFDEDKTDKTDITKNVRSELNILIESVTNLKDKLNSLVKNRRRWYRRLDRRLIHYILFSINRMELKIKELKTEEMRNADHLALESQYSQMVLLKFKYSEHLLNFKSDNESDNDEDEHFETTDCQLTNELEDMKFDGSPQQWPAFIKLYKKMFHCNNKLTNLVKFIRLQDLIPADLFNATIHLSMEGENYLLMYHTIVSKYENTTEIILNNVNCLFKTPKMKTPEFDELSQLYRHLTLYVGSLKDHIQSIELWDAWLVTLVCSRLDEITFGEWQSQQSLKELPLYSDMEKFLTNKIAALEINQTASNEVSSTDDKNTQNSLENASQISDGTDKMTTLHIMKQPVDKKFMCIVCCYDYHQLDECEYFLNLPVESRKNIVFKYYHCFKCLQWNHSVKTCKSSICCDTCGKDHHTLLHYNVREHAIIDIVPNLIHEFLNTDWASKSTKHEDLKRRTRIQATLPTAIVYVRNVSEQLVPCRVILDSHSKLNFITNDCVQRLGLPMTNVTGIGKPGLKGPNKCTVILQSRFDDERQFILRMYLMANIVHKVPLRKYDIDEYNIPIKSYADAADPLFNVPNTVDMILGLRSLRDIIKTHQIMVHTHLAVQDTLFGYIFTSRLLTDKGKWFNDTGNI